MKGPLKLIEERHSDRVLFNSKRPVAKKDLEQILEAARWAPTAHNMQNFEIVVVDDKKILGAIAKIKRPMSEAFIRENYPLLSFSKEELLKRKVGILGSTFPPSWRDPEKLDEAVREAAPMPLGEQISSTPVLLVVLYDPSRRAPASEGDFFGHISLGCMTENMWIMADSLGIGFHIVSNIGTNTVEDEVKSILNIPPALKIVYGIRLGYVKGKKAKLLRVRRDVEDFTHHNRYGSKGI
jgi:nitroreductase